MPNCFIISDHHFGHANILTFQVGGFPLRVFDNVEHMNETMVSRHNSVVSPKDKVYFLGDVAFGSQNLRFLERMNGSKVLIKGNHDRDKMSNYLKYFKDVRSSHLLDKMVLSHVPLHPDCLVRWGPNIHGHLHSHQVMATPHLADKRYFNVSVERLHYTPIALEEVKKFVSLMT